MKRKMLAAMVLASMGLPGFTPAIGADSYEVEISNAWIRSTVPGQPVAGAYLDLRAASAMKLVGVSSPVSARGEIHEMKDEDGMMKMRAVKAVDLPAGKTVNLAPGSLHVMLSGLKQPLAEGAKVSLTLKFRRASGSTYTRVIEVPVRAPGDTGSHDQHK